MCIRILSYGCFAVVLAIWVGVDMNGQFLHMASWLTSLSALLLAAAGCLANYMMFRHVPKQRFLAVVMGGFCAYCLYDLSRHLLGQI
jgi:hypothetical protein